MFELKPNTKSLKLELNRTNIAKSITFGLKILTIGLKLELKSNNHVTFELKPLANQHTCMDRELNIVQFELNQVEIAGISRLWVTNMLAKFSRPHLQKCCPIQK